MFILFKCHTILILTGRFTSMLHETDREKRPRERAIGRNGRAGVRDADKIGQSSPSTGSLSASLLGAAIQIEMASGISLDGESGRDLASKTRELRMVLGWWVLWRGDYQDCDSLERGRELSRLGRR